MSTAETILLEQIAARLAAIEQTLKAPGSLNGAAHKAKHIERTGPAWNAKLDPDKVKSVRALLALGFSQHKVARVHGVSRAAIQAIAEGKTWRSVPSGSPGVV